MIVQGPGRQLECSCCSSPDRRTRIATSGPCVCTARVQYPSASCCINIDQEVHVVWLSLRMLPLTLPPLPPLATRYACCIRASSRVSLPLHGAVHVVKLIVHFGC